MRLQRAGISSKTREQYERVWREYNSDVEAWGVSRDEGVVLYLAKLNSKGYAPQTIMSQCSALKYMSQETGGDFGAEGFLLSQVLKGIQRTGKMRPQELFVVSADQVHKSFKLIELFAKTSYESVLFCAAVHLMFYGLCRAGEIMDSDHTLKKRDVEFCNGKLLLTFRTHKSLKRTGRPQLVRIPPTGMDISLECIRLYDRVRPQTTGDENYLVWQNWAPLKVAELRAALERIKSNVFGVDSVTLHAFRRGGAVHMYKNGVPEREIQTIGRWAGQSHLVYLSKTK